MLRQEINLFTSFEKKPEPFNFVSWYTLCVSNLALLALLFIIYIITWMQVYSLNNQLKSLTLTANHLHNQIQIDKSKMPAIFFDKDVKEALQQFEISIDKQQKLLSAIKVSLPFSLKLTTIAEIIPENVWLTYIAITEHGTSMTLKGYSTNKEFLQKFILNILQHPHFTGGKFNISNIENIVKENQNGRLLFEINIVKKNA